MEERGSDCGSFYPQCPSALFFAYKSCRVPAFTDDNGTGEPRDRHYSQVRIERLEFRELWLQV